MSAESRARSRARPLLAAGVSLAAIALALYWAQRPPEGPVDPTWSRTPCSHCGMLVSERAYAAQLHTPAGEVRYFDDAGCLLLHAEEHPGEEAKAWFHHLREERWIPATNTGFVAVEGTPMSYGLGAVDASDPGAIARAEALRDVKRRESERRRGAP